jgi:branched-chain amino acid transport system permease protein
MITLAIASAFFYFTRQKLRDLQRLFGVQPRRAAALFGVDWRQPVPFYYLTLGCGGDLLCRRGLCLASALRAGASGGTGQPAADGGAWVQRHRPPDCRIHLRQRDRRHRGILLVWQNAQISPGTAGIPAVIDILVIAVVGGIARPIGPFIGALIYVLLRTFSPDVLTTFGMSGERFKLLIGLGFLAVVFFSPDGVLGLWERWKERRRRARDPLTGGEP